MEAILKNQTKNGLFQPFLDPSMREARGIPKNQWLSLANAKENSEKLNLSTLLVGIAGIEPAASSM